MSVRETFTGGDAANIDDRIPDGGGYPAAALGIWDSLGTINNTDRMGIESGSAVNFYNTATPPSLGRGNTNCYVVKNLGIGADQSVSARVVFPAPADPDVHNWQYMVVRPAFFSSDAPTILAVGLLSDFAGGATIAGVTITGLSQAADGRPISYTATCPGATSGPATSSDRLLYVMRVSTGHPAAFYTLTQSVTVSGLPSLAHIQVEIDPFTRNAGNNPPGQSLSNGSNTISLNNENPTASLVPGYRSFSYRHPRATTLSVTTGALSITLQNGRYTPFGYQSVSPTNWWTRIAGNPYVSLLARAKSGSGLGYEAMLNLCGLVGIRRSYGDAFVLHDLGANLVRGQEYDFRFCVSGTNPIILRVYLDGVLKIEFNTATDTTLPFGSQLYKLTSGDPGLGVTDGLLLWDISTPKGDTKPYPLNASGYPGLDKKWVRVLQWQVGLTNGDPGTPGTPPSFAAWIWTNGRFRQTTDLPVYDRGKIRTPAEGASIWDLGAMRKIVVIPETFGDPGDLPPDVGCIDVTTLPPTQPPLPLGTRLYLCAQLPDALYGDGTATPFNSTTEPMGTFILNRLARAAATGMIIMGTQGGYQKFQTGGAYDPDTMDAFIDAHAAIESDLYAYFLSSNFYGVSAFDDFESRLLWPPNGISVAEVKRVATRWKSVLPWVRVGLRGRPTQFIGESLTGYLDFLRCSYHTRLGSPAAWRDTEVAAAASIGVPAIVWGMNWTKGGAGGGFMTPTQIVDVGNALSDPATEAGGIANHGGGGWRYDAPQFSVAGMIAAFTTYRNALAAL